MALPLSRIKSSHCRVPPYFPVRNSGSIIIAKLGELYSLKGKNLEADIKSRTEQERTTKTQTDTTGELATNLERAASAAQALNGVSLAGLQGQVQGLYGTVERLRGAL